MLSECATCTVPEPLLLPFHPPGALLYPQSLSKLSSPSAAAWPQKCPHWLLCARTPARTSSPPDLACWAKLVPLFRALDFHPST